MEKRQYSSQGWFFKPFCTPWSLEESPKQIMMRQKSPSLCWSKVLSLLQPSAAEGERHASQIAPVWHSWNCCLLPGTDIHRANDSVATTLNQPAISMLFYRSHSCAPLLGLDVYARLSWRWEERRGEGAPGLLCTLPRPTTYQVAPGLCLHSAAWATQRAWDI